MAAICMIHMETIVEPSGRFPPTLEQTGGPADHLSYSGGQPALPRLSDSRLKYLRLFDRWVDCSCGCGRQWNFASDPPDALRDDRRMRVRDGEKCQAVLDDGADDSRSVKSSSGSSKGRKIFGGLLGGSGSGSGKGKGIPQAHRLSEYQQNNLRSWFALDPVEQYEQAEQIGGLVGGGY